MSDPVSLGCIGVGKWGTLLADKAAGTGRFDVTSGFSRTAGTREQFAEKFGARAPSSLDELLNDDEIEAVFIASAHATHRDHIEQAAAAGKHVFVEKPFTLTTEEGRAAIAATEKAGVVLQVGHQRRRLPGLRAMKKLVDDGSIGDIHMLEANHSLPNGFNIPKEAWRWNPGESPLGSMTSLGIHQIDSFQYLAGPIAEVSTQTRAGRDFTIDEATGLLFEFESGAVGTLLTSFFTPLQIRIAIHGTEGAAMSDQDGSRLEYQASGAELEEQPLDEIDPISDQLVEFADAVRGETEPEVGGEEGLEVVAVLQAAVASADSGAKQSVDDFR